MQNPRPREHTAAEKWLNRHRKGRPGAALRAEPQVIRADMLGGRIPAQEWAVRRLLPEDKTCRGREGATYGEKPDYSSAGDQGHLGSDRAW